MSVLIKGMEMPASCPECPMADTIMFCCLTRKAYNWGLVERPSDCPLIEVPPHGDLIDIVPFVQYIKEHWDSYDQWFVDQIEARPIVIEAEDGER